jgi:hypothetical protein
MIHHSVNNCCYYRRHFHWVRVVTVVVAVADDNVVDFGVDVQLIEE